MPIYKRKGHKNYSYCRGIITLYRNKSILSYGKLQTKPKGNHTLILIAYLNLEKAIDRERRDMVCKNLNKKCVYEKNIKVIKIAYKENKNYIRAQNMECKWFTTKNEGEELY